MSRATATAGNNGSPFPDDTAAAREARAAAARDRRDQLAADRHRAREASEASAASGTAAGVADALADLRAVMAANADVLTSSEVLTHVANVADSRSVDRYATTCGVLLRVVLAVPPSVVLPPTIGAEVSLNLLLAAVGVSGAGKGAADKTAAAAVRLRVGGQPPVTPLPMLPIGTGEGINRTYARSERDKLTGQVITRWNTDRALFGCRDIATLDALASRQGATLVPELLKAAMGEELGFANADKERRVILPMHSYRLCLSAGVQPDNGAVLLNEQAQRDGWPQRFLWTPTRPGEARRRRLAGGDPLDPLTVVIPDFGLDPMRAAGADPDTAADTGGALVPMGVAESIAQQIIDADAAKDADPFGRCGDPLAGHRLLAQLKVAAALAVLHNRTYIGAEDWQRAERLTEVSDAVTRVVAAESDRAAGLDAQQRGRLDGQRLAAADDARDAAKVRTVIDRVRRYLSQQTEWVSHGAVNRSLTSKHRPHLADGLLALLDAHEIETRKTKRADQDVIEYRMAGR